MNQESAEFTSDKSDEKEDASERRIRLLRIGVRNKDMVTLDAVKDDIVNEYGEEIGIVMYENLFLAIVQEINKEGIKKQFGIDLDDPETYTQRHH